MWQMHGPVQFSKATEGKEERMGKGWGWEATLMVAFISIIRSVSQSLVRQQMLNSICKRIHCNSHGLCVVFREECAHCHRIFPLQSTIRHQQRVSNIRLDRSNNRIDESNAFDSEMGTCKARSPRNGIGVHSN